jgi:hypothetical protein
MANGITLMSPDMLTLTESEWIENHRHDVDGVIFHPESWRDAVRHRKYKILEWLVSHPDVKTPGCYSFVFRNLQPRYHRECYMCLVRAGKRLYDEDEEDMHPIFDVVRAPIDDIVNDMIERESCAVLNKIRDPATKNDVMHAFLEFDTEQSKRFQYIKKLIEKGVDYNRDIEPRINGSVARVHLNRRLIDSASPVDIKISEYLADKYGVRPGIAALYIGLGYARVDIIQFYMKYNKLPTKIEMITGNRTRSDNVGLLVGLFHLYRGAVRAPNFDSTIRFLLENGCDVNIASDPGNITVFHCVPLYNTRINEETRIALLTRAINPNRYAFFPSLNIYGSPLDVVSTTVFADNWKNAIPLVRYTNARFNEHAVPNKRFDYPNGTHNAPHKALPIIRKFHNRVYCAVALIKSGRLPKDIIRMLVLQYIDVSHNYYN